MDKAIAVKRSYRHIVYALISIACPFIAGGIVSLYQDYAYAEFFSPKCCPVDDADINAGAMMAAVVVFQLIFAIVLGSLIGLVFAAMSLRRKPRLLSLGTAALLFNLTPFLLVVVLLLNR